MSKRVIVKRPALAFDAYVTLKGNALINRAIFTEDKFPRSGDPANIELNRIYLDKHNFKHRESSSRKLTWQVQEDDGMPSVDHLGVIRYYNSKHELHRLHGPAIEYPNGKRSWYINGKLHRIDGPAIEQVNGEGFGEKYRAWYQNGKRHRLDGPAIEYSGGEREWDIDGQFIGNSDDGFTEEDFENYKREHGITASKLSWQVHTIEQSIDLVGIFYIVVNQFAPLDEQLILDQEIDDPTIIKSGKFVIKGENLEEIIMLITTEINSLFSKHAVNEPWGDIVESDWYLMLATGEGGGTYVFSYLYPQTEGRDISIWCGLGRQLADAEVALKEYVDYDEYESVFEVV